MIAIDANIFLELFLGQEKAQECEEFLGAAYKDKRKYVVSAFTVDGVILMIERKKKSLDSANELILNLMRSVNIITYPNLNPDKISAIKIMKKYNLDSEDALTLQCALQLECKEIVSFDKHFDKVKEIKRITPKEAMMKYGNKKI